MDMKTKYPIGILGATGMVGQRYIQLLENHPWFEVAWLAASDRSSGKTYGEAAKWRLDTPLPERIAKMTVSAAEPEGAPKIIFSSIDSHIAKELEPKFAAAGCAVLSNSSAFRMTPNVPLVIPEINAEHLHLIEEQPWRKESGGYLVTNNLSANAHGNGYADPDIYVSAALGSVGTDAGAYNVLEGNHSLNLAATYDLRPHLQRPIL